MTHTAPVRPDRWITAIAVLGMLLVLLPVGFTHALLWQRVLQDTLHGPVFAAVALAVLGWLRNRGETPRIAHYAIAFTATAGMGAATEVMQALGPRSPSIRDWTMDVAGAAAALAMSGHLQLRRRAGPRLRVALGGTLLMATAACSYVLLPLAWTGVAYANRAWRFPEIVAPHAPWLAAIDRRFLSGRPTGPAVVRMPDAWRRGDDEYGFHVLLPPGQWPGITHTEPTPDWRGYATLAIDVTNPGSQPLELTLRVHDAGHANRFDDRFNRAFVLPAATRQTLRVPLADIERGPRNRRLDMGRIAGLTLFRTGESRQDQLYVTRIALEK